jgi:hypothetical protein
MSGNPNKGSLNTKDAPTVVDEPQLKTNCRMACSVLCIFIVIIFIHFSENCCHNKQHFYSTKKKENFNDIVKNTNSEKYIINKSLKGKFIKIISKYQIPVKKVNVITNTNILYSFDIYNNNSGVVITHERGVNSSYILSLEFHTDINISEIIIESDITDITAKNLESAKIYIRNTENKIVYESSEYLTRQTHNSIRLYNDTVVFKTNIEQPVETLIKYTGYVETDPKKYDDEDRIFHLIH